MINSSSCEYRPKGTVNGAKAPAMPLTDAGDVDAGEEPRQMLELSAMDHTEFAPRTEFSQPESWNLQSETILSSRPATGNQVETIRTFHDSLWDTNTWLAMGAVPPLLGAHHSTYPFSADSIEGFPFLSVDTNMDYPPLNQAVTEPATHMSEPRQHIESAQSTIESLTESRTSIGSPSEEANTAVPSSNHTSDHVTPLPRKDDPCLEFPTPSPDTFQSAKAEMFGHVGVILDHHIQSIHRFYQQQRSCESSVFISKEILHAFVELYLEYFDPKFPFLHRSKFRGTGLEWVTLIGIAAVGSQYSLIPGKYEYGLVLQDLLGRALRDCVCGMPFVLRTCPYMSFRHHHNQR